MHDFCQLQVCDPEASVLKVIINDTLLNQLLKNVGPKLQSVLFRQCCILRVLLQFITISRFKLIDANIDTVDFRSIIGPDRGEARATNKYERQGDDSEDNGPR
jgi:hypothetical protein